MNNSNIKIEESWKIALHDQFEKDYFKNLSKFIRDEYKTKKVFPEPKNIFRAFDLTPFSKVKVVILGQDPYHGVGQANGLSFAVNKDISLPPSLQNIFKEIKDDLNIEPDKNGDLSRWAEQGVLLLNATLTVCASNPGSHQGKGWEEFTNSAMKKLSDERNNIVFILWGNYAKKKCSFIDRQKHLVIESAHPSPFSAYNGFFGSKPFSRANKYLRENGLSEIEWK